ncbi:MAG: site-specific integrase [Planctomycetes bacterium]|nr:site-specific integrase [Planctomycetota bacterium]
MPSGSKIFFLDYRFNGRRRALTLGRFGDPLTVDQARNLAEVAKTKVIEGVDPQTEKIAARVRNATIADLIACYREHRLPELRTSTVPNHQHFLDLIGKKWGRREISTISATDTECLLRDFRSKKSEKTGRQLSVARVNRLAAMVSALFSFGLTQAAFKDAIPVNPARGVRRVQEHSRARIVIGGELKRLLTAIEENEPRFRALWMLLWLTACRRSEILTATWVQIDLEAGVLHLPRTKNGDPRSVSLSSPAVEIIRALPRTVSPYLLPSAGRPDRPISGLSKAWARILAMAEVQNLRVHDLRRSAASSMVAHGATMPEVMAILGHARDSSVGVTLGVYLHATPDSLRPIMEAHAARTETLLGQPLAKADSQSVVS